MADERSELREWVERNLTEQSRYEWTREMVFLAMDAAWKGGKQRELLDWTSDEIVRLLRGIDARIKALGLVEVMHHIDGWFEAYSNGRREP